MPASPVRVRYELLDVLRGMALAGICIANFGELSLYTFQPAGVTSAMPTARIDGVVKFFQYFLIDGKFYTLFSLLFGIGFSIILSNCENNGRNATGIFYRRMGVLALFGILHMILLWAGDILLLYALLGMLLPLFRKVTDRKLLLFAGALLVFPVIMETFTVLTGGRYSLMIPVNRAVDYFHARAGIDWDNFGTWLRDNGSYADVVRFNTAGFFIRCGEFIEGNRVFKVLGLFLLGFYIGRNRLFADTASNRRLMRRVCRWGFAIGIPLSAVYAWNAVSGSQLGIVGSEAVYTLSVFPLGLAYAAAVYLWYYGRERKVGKYIAAPGRMALTNYIGQSVIGIIIFYGIGFSLGATMGLLYVDIIAAGVFLFQTGFSLLWLKYFTYGPLEWIWRMLTYGQYLRLKK